MENLTEALAVFFTAIVVVVLTCLLMAYPLMWCWNYVMPFLFGLKTITWGQAWCLGFVSSYLFKSSHTHSN